MKRRLLLVTLLLWAGACGAAQAGPESRTRTRSDRLTHEEILRTELTNMYDVIQRLQPAWLVAPQTRGRTMEVGVFMNGLHVGGLDFLRQIPATQVTEARYLDGGQVGSEITGGRAFTMGAAIMLTSIRMQAPAGASGHRA